ncbi:MAG: DUF362 domain-containing protein [Syntrophomonadaceae bacterium]|jgi:uncharacterized protein (DUF362 family)
MSDKLVLARAELDQQILNRLLEEYQGAGLDVNYLHYAWESWQTRSGVEAYYVHKDNQCQGLVVFDQEQSLILEMWVWLEFHEQGLEAALLDALVKRENLIAVQVLAEDRRRYDILVEYGFRPTRTFRIQNWQLVKLDLSTAVLLKKIKNRKAEPPYTQKETVAIEKVPASQEYEEIKQSLKGLIDKLGGLERYVKTGQTVVIKPNIVSDHGLKKDGTVVGGVVTDKKVVKALVELLLPLAGKVIVAEGSSINRSATTKMFAHYGYDEVVALDPKKVSLVDLNTDQLIEKPVPGGKRMQSRQIPVTLQEADVIISMPVMKIHFAAIVSLSIKNLQGAVPPLEKYMSHFFGLWQNLVNTNHLVKPDLIIIDGTTGQEDFGPISGTPKPMNLLIGGTNPVAVDAVTMRIMGIEPTESPPVLLAYLQGFGPVESEMIEIVGPSPEELCDPFKRPRLDLSSGRDFTVHVGEACSGCRAYLHFTLSKLRKADPQDLSRQLIDRPFENRVNIFLGPSLEKEIDPRETNIFMGICQQHNAHLGVHLPGCPPHSEVIIDGIFKCFPDVQKAKYADQSEESSLGEMLNKILADLK